MPAFADSPTHSLSLQSFRTAVDWFVASSELNDWLRRHSKAPDRLLTKCDCHYDEPRTSATFTNGQSRVVRNTRQQADTTQVVRESDTGRQPLSRCYYYSCLSKCNLSSRSQALQRHQEETKTEGQIAIQSSRRLCCPLMHLDPNIAHLKTTIHTHTHR